ncbi:MAG: AMP-binding protein, partial [Roseiarcus sp.]
MSEQPWIKSYPPGVRWDADFELTAVQDVLTNSAKQWPNQASHDFMGRKITFAELDALANRAAQGFQRLGVKPGVHVGLFLPNSP